MGVSIDANSRPAGDANAKKVPSPFAAKKDANPPAAPAAARQEAKPQQGPDQGRSAAEALDVLREAIFADHIKRINQRIEDLDDKLEAKINDLGQRVSESFAAFEKHVRGELKSQVAKLEAETEDRQKDRRELKDRIEKLQGDVDGRIDKMGNELRSMEEASRRMVAQKTQELTDMLDTTKRDLSERVEDMVNNLEGNKADRTQIGDLLREMGERMRIADEGAAGSAPPAAQQ